jgi:hypothetical protein
MEAISSCAFFVHLFHALYFQEHEFNPKLPLCKRRCREAVLILTNLRNFSHEKAPANTGAFNSLQITKPKPNQRARG